VVASLKRTAKTFASKIFNSYEFGYRRVTIERPLRLSAQITDERDCFFTFCTEAV
jgi:type I restriction enzyme M protein